MTGGLASFQLSYEISPIILTGGSAANLPGGMLPIISLLQPGSYTGGPLTPADVALTFGEFIAHFAPMAGGHLVAWDAATYPFANQLTAANAMISKPLELSLRMTAPAGRSGTYPSKLATYTSLKTALDNHIMAGGLFSVATPSFLYQNCILLDVVDITGGDTGGQVQVEWQWTFRQPLVTLAAAQAAQGPYVAKVTAGVQTTGDPPTGTGITVTQGNPGSGAAAGIIPAARPTAGSSPGTGQSAPTGTPGP